MRNIWMGVFGILMLSTPLFSQVKINSLKLPEIEGFKILKCDFHMHTVYSDGMVWPVTRVNEAFQEGLDAIAITDHIEYRPKLDEFTSKDHLKSYELAKKTADELGVLLIKGTEITRRMSPGHFNAIFINDANVFETFVNVADTRDGTNINETLAEAKRQGGFVFWNHPWFQHPENRSEWQAAHEQLYVNGLIGGIEVINGDRYDPIILQWCLDKKLTVLSTSDVHTPMVLQKGDYRPVTLVFAKERSENAIKQALINRQTVAYSKGCLYGSKELVYPLVDKSIHVGLKLISDKRIILVVENKSGIAFNMEVVEANGLKLGLQPYPNLLTLEAQSVNAINVTSTIFEKGKEYEIKLKVNNAQVGANKALDYSIKFKL